MDKAIETEKEKWYNIGKGIAYQNSPSFKDYINSINKKQL